ncbi:porin family protein [Vibrio sp. DW001]|uniref:outer membrane beta-barrel protein n=1 Tax=Vibrio sp. DW001 TaxID=2912315 RepID=UPI0023B05ECF|nr:outer membrane beta-barrel protein [Vibrio sp. DW001]WED29544.1 porin family protein [Vibrio sp. DW001]
MKGISLVPLALISLPFFAIADEAPADSSAQHQLGVRGGWVTQQPEYEGLGEADDRTTGHVYGIDYTFLKPFGESGQFKWGVNGGVDKISNTVYFGGSNSGVDVDYYSTRAAGVFAYGITQQIDVYGKLGLSYNYGDFGPKQINGVGIFEAVGFSYQSSNGAFSAIEGQIDTFNDDLYEAPFSLSLIIRAGFTF